MRFQPPPERMCEQAPRLEEDACTFQDFPELWIELELNRKSGFEHVHKYKYHRRRQIVCYRNSKFDFSLASLASPLGQGPIRSIKICIYGTIRAKIGSILKSSAHEMEP